jgi:hypothetical protein
MTVGKRKALGAYAIALHPEAGEREFELNSPPS